MSGRKGRGVAKKRRREQRPGRNLRDRDGEGRTARSRGETSSTGLPLWILPLAYGALTLILFREFVASGEMLFGSDTLALGYMARAFYADALREMGTFPLWNPILFGGTPFLESLAGGDSLHPISVFLLLIMDTYRALGWKLVIHIFLAGFFMFGWVRCLGLSRAAAFLSGVAFLTAPYMVTLVYPGHDGKLFVTALTPLLFWATEVALVRRSFPALAGMSGTIALVILTTHFQMAYFLFGAVGAYAVFRTVQMAQGPEGRWVWPEPLRRFGLFLLFAFIGAGVSGVQLIPAVAYVTEDSRRAVHTEEVAGAEGIEWSSSWSLHPEELVSLAVPEFVGNNAGSSGWTTDTYWGRNAFKLNHEYLGLVALLLAGIGFLGGPLAGLRWFFSGLGAVALLFALGTHTPVWRIFYEVVPGIRLFRAPSMIIFVTGFAVATLLAVGVERARSILSSGTEAESRALQRYLWGATGALGVLFLLVAIGLLPDLWARWIRGAMEPQQEQAFQNVRPFMTQGFLVSALLAAVLAGTGWALSRRILPPWGGLALVAILIAVDQGRVNEPFIQIQNYSEFAAPDENLRFLESRWSDDDPFRVFSMAQGGEDVRPGMFGVELAAGHHPNDLRRYRELIGMEGGGIPEHLAGFNTNVLQLLNVRYILWPVAQFGELEGVEPVSEVRLADGRLFSAVYEFPALPRAWLVGEVEVIPEEDRALGHILSGEFDPATQAVLPEPPPEELEGTGPVIGQVDWVERRPNRLRLEVETDGPALLVISENWFPAWRAEVNGEDAPVLRANHTLRAIPVPGGSADVELRYSSPLLQASLGVSLLSLLVLLGTVAGTWWTGRIQDEGGEAVEG